VVHLRREDKCLTNGAKHPNTGNKFKNHQMSEESKKISKPLLATFDLFYLMGFAYFL
jgi:hypothetical protein